MRPGRRTACWPHQVRPITPGFFRTLGIPQMAGRDFADFDTLESPPVAIVSEELVRQQFPDGRPIGRWLRINVDHGNGRGDIEWTMVGVVGNTGRHWTARSAQTSSCRDRSVPARHHGVVRTGGSMLLANSVTAGWVARDGAGSAGRRRTLEEVIGNSIACPRAISMLLGVFALVVVLLRRSGSMADGVLGAGTNRGNRRRMALGATAGSVFRLVIGQALRLVSIGVVVGLAAAAALTRVLEPLLFEVDALNPWTFAVTALVLLVVATVASYVPARRSMRLAPVEALSGGRR